MSLNRPARTLRLVRCSWGARVPNAGRRVWSPFPKAGELYRPHQRLSTGFVEKLTQLTQQTRQIRDEKTLRVKTLVDPGDQDAPIGPHEIRNFAQTPDVAHRGTGSQSGFDSPKGPAEIQNQVDLILIRIGAGRSTLRPETAADAPEPSWLPVAGSCFRRIQFYLYFAGKFPFGGSAKCTGTATLLDCSRRHRNARVAKTGLVERWSTHPETFAMGAAQDEAGPREDPASFLDPVVVAHFGVAKRYSRTSSFSRSLAPQRRTNPVPVSSYLNSPPV